MFAFASWKCRDLAWTGEVQKTNANMTSIPAAAANCIRCLQIPIEIVIIMASPWRDDKMTTTIYNDTKYAIEFALIEFCDRQWREQETSSVFKSMKQSSKRSARGEKSVRNGWFKYSSVKANTEYANWQ